MKKIISLMLVFVFMFTFACCGNEKKEEESGTLDIEYYAKLGQMPECNYDLGTDPEKIKSELSSLSESENADDMVYNVTEGENNVLIDNGTLCYYYKKAEPEKGIGCIVNYGKAYGFEIGTVIVEVKKAISGCDYIEEPMNEENLIPMNERSKSEVRELGRKGGIKSGEARREKKLFKEAIEKKLGQSLDSMIDSMINQAQNGNVQAITFLRDTIGEKPTDKVSNEVSISYESVLREMADIDEYKY